MTTKEKNPTIPFPSHVTDGCLNEDAKGLASELIDTTRDLNNVYEAAGNVHYFVRGHYVDLINGDYGIERLIARILKDNGAEFNADVAKTEHADLAKTRAMFSDDIIKIVHSEKFGIERYPAQTIRSYLSHFMSKNGTVQKFQLTNLEDKPRLCPRPRCKFYLVKAK